MTVSEKRMASAYEILIAAGAEYFNTYYDEGEPGELYENGLVASIAPHVAAALAAAEREGMRRAAEICDEIGDREDVLAISAGSDDLTPLYRRGERAAKECSHMILSEIGEA